MEYPLRSPEAFLEETLDGWFVKMGRVAAIIFRMNKVKKRKRFPQNKQLLFFFG